LRTGIYDYQLREIEVSKSDTHRRGEDRSIRALDLDADPTAALDHQQVEFGTLVSSPEVLLVGLNHAKRLLDYEALPRRTALWMGEQRRMGSYAEQLMQQAVNQMSGAMQNMSPEDMARMKDMLAELNAMLAQRAAGEEPDFDGFMDRASENQTCRDRFLRQANHVSEGVSQRTSRHDSSKFQSDEFSHARRVAEASSR
jgi:hypothetical protein